MNLNVVVGLVILLTGTSVVISGVWLLVATAVRGGYPGPGRGYAAEPATPLAGIIRAITELLNAITKVISAIGKLKDPQQVALVAIVLGLVFDIVGLFILIASPIGGGG